MAAHAAQPSLGNPQPDEDLTTLKASRHPTVFLLMGRDFPNSASHSSPDLVSCDPAEASDVVSNEIHDNP